MQTGSANKHIKKKKSPLQSVNKLQFTMDFVKVYKKATQRSRKLPLGNGHRLFSG